MNTDTVRTNTDSIWAETSAQPTAAPASMPDGPVTAREILRTMERITQQTQHLDEAFSTLQAIQTSRAEPMSPADVAGQAKSEAVAAIVATREATNQQMLTMLEEMYQDSRPAPAPRTMSENEMTILREMLKMVPELETEDQKEVHFRILDRMG